MRLPYKFVRWKELPFEWSVNVFVMTLEVMTRPKGKNRDVIIAIMFFKLPIKIRIVGKIKYGNLYVKAG
jgi:hypothetical protein